MTEIREKNLKQVVKVEPAAGSQQSASQCRPINPRQRSPTQVKPTINHRVSKINLSAD